MEAHPLGKPSLPHLAKTGPFLIAGLVMNFSHQLIHLILDFYREDPEQYHRVAAIQHCHLSRQWGTLRIHCSDSAIAYRLIRAIDLIQEPIAQLRLARRLKIWVDGGMDQVFPVGERTALG